MIQMLKTHHVGCDRYISPRIEKSGGLLGLIQFPVEFGSKTM
jgi:hypothetical protein